MKFFQNMLLVLAIVVASQWAARAEPLDASIRNIQLGMKLSEAVKAGHLKLDNFTKMEQPSGSKPGVKAFIYEDPAHPPVLAVPFEVAASVTREDGELVSFVSGYALDVNGKQAVQLGDSLDSVKKALGPPAQDVYPGDDYLLLGYWARVARPYRAQTYNDQRGTRPIKCGWLELVFDPATKKLEAIMLCSECPPELTPPIR